MAKKIFFSGLKGGTGKTTLAIYFCNFICYYLFKTKAFGVVLLAKEITTLDKLCILPNIRIANETLSKKEDFKALVAFQQIKAIAPLIAYSQAMRRVNFDKIEKNVFYKYREAFNYLICLKCLTELPEKVKT